MSGKNFAVVLVAAVLTSAVVVVILKLLFNLGNTASIGGGVAGGIVGALSGWSLSRKSASNQ